MNTQIVILAAGKGTRMDNGDLPKVLVPLKNRPLILHLLSEIDKLELPNKPLIVVGYKFKQVQEALGSKYNYVLQEQQLGTGHAVMVAEKKIKAENILVLYGDQPFIKKGSLEKLLKLHQNKKSILSMFTTIVPNFEGIYKVFDRFGKIIRDSYGNIIKITEYKDASTEEQKIREVNPAIYIFNAKWLWKNIYKLQNYNAQNEFYLTDMVEIAISEGIKINTLVINPKEVLGINTNEQLKTAELFL